MGSCFAESGIGVGHYQTIADQTEAIAAVGN